MTGRDAKSYSLEAERRYYCRALPQTARDYRWLGAYLDCLPGAAALLTGREVLDIGAGECLYSALIAERYAARVVALELLSERMQPAARVFRLPNLFFVAGDCHQLPFPNASFDTVFGDLVLHHFPVLEPILAEICRVLRPGGAYVGIEPNFSNPAQRVLHSLRTKTANERPLSGTELRRLFTAAGFHVELHYFWQRFPWLRQRFLTTSVGILARS